MAAGRAFKGTDDEHFNDQTNPKNAHQYIAMIKELGLNDFIASLWDSQNVWFLGEELFVQSGGKCGRSPWHQDTSYMAANGDHLANLWISFESLPRGNSLEIVRGSHRGIQYDGGAYADPSDPTRPLWGNGHFPRLPDIEADRKKNPGIVGRHFMGPGTGRDPRAALRCTARRGTGYRGMLDAPHAGAPVVRGQALL